MNDTQVFLEALFSAKPASSYILLWTLPAKRSWWAQSLDAVVSILEKPSVRTPSKSRARTDLYIGVGLSPRNYGPNARCPQDKIAGIVGLWADIDIAHPVHKKPNLPPDQDAAMAIVNAIPLAPTLIVHSGHGLQAWWLLDRPWIFRDEAERRQARTLSQAWQIKLQGFAAESGYAIDSTGDLARLLRVPGTTNNKEQSTPVPVQLLLSNGPHHTLEDISQATLGYGSRKTQSKAPPTRSPSKGATGAQLVLNPDASPPSDKLLALQEIDPKFLRTIQGKRPDLTDQSASGYDMALASRAAAVGWSDQEIADLLIQAGRRRGDDLKTLNYYQRTIQQAREPYEQTSALRELGGLEQTASEDQRTTILAGLSKLWGVTLVAIEKYQGNHSGQLSEGFYRLRVMLADEERIIDLGAINNLLDQNLFRRRFVDGFRAVPARMKGIAWDNLVTRILEATETVDIGPEGSGNHMLAVWLQSFLEHQPVSEDWEVAMGIMTDMMPPLRDPDTGKLWVNSTALRLYVFRAFGEVIKVKDLALLLRSHGAVASTQSRYVKKTKSSVSRWLWELP